MCLEERTLQAAILNSSNPEEVAAYSNALMQFLQAKKDGLLDTRILKGDFNEYPPTVCNS